MAQYGHPSREDIPALGLSRRQDVPPPLVRCLVSRDLEGEVDGGAVARQEADPLGERDIGGKALGIRGEVGKLAELQLLPGVREEPFRVVLAGGVQQPRISSTL